MSYQIFDDKKAEEYDLVVTSNANIREVCRVLTQCYTLSEKDRVYYAQHGDIQPDIDEESEEATYNFKNRYDEVTVWAALAEVLFYDGPELLAYDDNNTAYVPDEKQDQFDKLIRAEVMAGRDDFLGKFGVSPPEVNELLHALANARTPQITTILNQMVEGDLPDTPSTNKMSETGEQSS